MSFRIVWLIAALVLGSGKLMAQGLFTPAITVNDRVITQYELNERVRLLEAFGVQGDVRERAKNDLIDDRLRLEAAAELGITVSEADLQVGLEQFAAQRQLGADELRKGLSARGLSEKSLLDFLESQLAWREVVQARFRRNATITESELDTALNLSAQAGRETIHFAEIGLPFAERGVEQTRALAEQIYRDTSRGASFAAAARRYSRMPSASSGGRTEPVPLQNLPPQVSGPLIVLRPGGVTRPVEAQAGIFIFQLLDIKNQGPLPASEVTVSYGTLRFPAAGGMTDAARASAAEMADRLDTCTDLAAFAHDRGEVGVVEPMSLADVPTDIALSLSRLDPGEVALDVERPGELLLVMLCTRSVAVETANREELRDALFNQRMVSYGDGYLQELRRDAVIVEN